MIKGTMEACALDLKTMIVAVWVKNILKLDKCFGDIN
jgi:hypothetical protein